MAPTLCGCTTGHGQDSRTCRADSGWLRTEDDFSYFRIVNNYYYQRVGQVGYSGVGWDRMNGWMEGGYMDGGVGEWRGGY